MFIEKFVKFVNPYQGFLILKLLEKINQSDGWKMINYQSFHYFYNSIFIFFLIISNSLDFKVQNLIVQNTAEYNTYKYENMFFIYFLLSVIDFS